MKISKSIKHFAFELISIQSSAQRNTNLFIILFSVFFFTAISIITLYYSKEHQTWESKRLITEIYKGVDEERARISRETITEIRNVCYNLNPLSFIDDTYFEITLALHLKARKIILTLLNIE